jgi:hypothetical protein
VKGIGRVTLRREAREIVFGGGERFSLDVLRGTTQDRPWQETVDELPVSPGGPAAEGGAFWYQVQAAEARFERGIENRSPGDLVSSLLDIDRVIWKGAQDLENPEFIAQARERFREMVVRLGSVLEGEPSDRTACFASLVDPLLRLREKYRHEKRWSDADDLRESLHEAGVVVEDTPDGARWKLQRRDL